MAASSYSSDVLQRYYGSIPWQHKKGKKILTPSDILQTRIFQISEAIQNLSPEIREIIYNEYVAIKQRERAALGWNKVHEDILKQPFCKYRKQIVPTIICLEYQDCRFEGCCYPCLISVKGRPRLHKVSMNPPMETIPLIETRHEYNNFLKICSDDWHEPCE